MKKLKAWQIVLLVLFYPIGICVLIYRIIKKSNIKRKEAEAARILREKKAKELQLAQAQREKIDAARATERAMFDTVYIKVVGVTFKNDNGTSRQAILRKLKFEDPPFSENTGVDITVERTEYKGEPAFSVHANGLQVGFVGKDDIPLFVSRWSDFSRVSEYEVTGGGKKDGRTYNYGMTIGCKFHKRK